MIEMLHTPNLTLRPVAPEDWDVVRPFFMSDRAEHIGGKRTLGQSWRQFAAELGHWQCFGNGMWAVTERTGGPAIGLVGPWCPPDWPEKEIGWMMFEGHEGKGYAFEAARATIQHAFTALGWATAVSYIAPGNTRSIALAERLGARQDDAAPLPEGSSCLVYRHPHPEAAQ